jgi:hypothetical protein
MTWRQIIGHALRGTATLIVHTADHVDPQPPEQVSGWWLYSDGQWSPGRSAFHASNGTQGAESHITWHETAACRSCNPSKRDHSLLRFLIRKG